MSNALTALFNVEKPIIQAPMAGVQDYRLAAAVSNAGGLGSLPCAMLGAEALREELKALNETTQQPYNLNFFAHTPPEPNPATKLRRSFLLCDGDTFRMLPVLSSLIYFVPGDTIF